MKKFIIYLIFLLMQNCYYIPNPVGPTHGLILTKNSFPGEFNPSNDVQRKKKAEGCLTQILYLVVWGDASAGGIAKANGILKIATIDHKTTNAMGVFATYCTIVSGE
jgi:hypothetical protein